VTRISSRELNCIVRIMLYGVRLRCSFQIYVGRLPGMVCCWTIAFGSFLFSSSSVSWFCVSSFFGATTKIHLSLSLALLEFWWFCRDSQGFFDVAYCSLPNEKPSKLRCSRDPFFLPSCGESPPMLLLLLLLLLLSADRDAMLPVQTIFKKPICWMFAVFDPYTRRYFWN